MRIGTVLGKIIELLFYYSMEEERKKRKLELNWDQLLPSTDEEPLAELVVTTNNSNNDQQHSQREEIKHMSDAKLNILIHRQIKNLENFGRTLPDKGVKLRAYMKLLEDEREHRKLQRLEKDADGHEKAKQSSNSGASNGCRQEAPSSDFIPQSSFASHFCKKMKQNTTDHGTINSSEKELSDLSPFDCHKNKENGNYSKKGRHKSKVKSRGFPFPGPQTIRVDRDECNLPNGDQKGRASPNISLCSIGANLSRCFSKKRDAPEVQTSNDSMHKKEQTIVLVDEEESQLPETMEQEELANCSEVTKIYYPSRNDPESVEICHSDIDCLAPEAFLSSTVMNFYIRHLQQRASPAGSRQCDYHFFNTYFYKKLKEAVDKKSDRGTFFVKFRRWWRGLNIFQKAYVLLPIHEDLHWSLVIICIPDKHDELGPIILHLDSLGLHCSRSIFNNIKSFLIEEWNYLNQGTAPPDDLPLSDRIWKNLPRRIDEEIITVPQQKNDYDCGIFVLYFMERFIEAVPERLKRKDLAMFGKQWFKPEEASQLRGKIQKLILKEFKDAIHCSSSLRDDSPSKGSDLLEVS